MTRRRLLDVGIGVACWLYLSALVLDAPDQRLTWWDVVALVVAPGLGAALVWRRSRPVPVLAGALAGGVLFQLVVPYGIFPVAALVALWSLAAARPPVLSLPALAGTLGVTALAARTERWSDVLFAMAVAALVWALGETLRNRRVAIEQSARRAVTEEQARIARELHDVLAHSVSVIVVQAAAADDVFDRRPEQARAALRSIEAAGREALGELRVLLAGVRPGSAPEPGPGFGTGAAAGSDAGSGAVSGAGSEGGGSGTVSEVGSVVRSRPGVGRLGELAAPLRAAGLAVTVDADVRPLPAALDLCAYRIVQEALTNTLRHAGASRAEVTVRAGAGVLELDVRDDGRAGPVGTGRGIAGMRERAAMLGGTVDAGPQPDGGFRVHATLPLAGR